MKCIIKIEDTLIHIYLLNEEIFLSFKKNNNVDSVICFFHVLLSSSQNEWICIVILLHVCSSDALYRQCGTSQLFVPNIVTYPYHSQVASYIPQLARFHPDLWGVAVCSVDGQRYEIGDTSMNFTMQSCRYVSFVFLFHTCRHNNFFRHNTIFLFSPYVVCCCA